MIEVERGLRLRVGSRPGEWIEVKPPVSVEELSDRDQLIIIKAVYRLQGNSPETYFLTKLV